MQNSMALCTFSASDGKNPFWANLVQKIKIVNLNRNLVLTNSNMKNSMVLFTFSDLDGKKPFWANLFQKIKIVSLS